MVPLAAWSRLSLRWKLVLLNGAVVLLAGVGVLMLTHAVPAPDATSVMHDTAKAPTPQAAQQTYQAAVDREVVPALVAATALALVLNFVVVTMALRPLRRVREASRRLAAGDVGARVGREGTARRDEIGDVARSFDDMAAELSRLEELRRSSTQDVAHELRTPIHNLLGLIEAMRDGVIGADADGLARAHAQILRLSTLVDDLRNLADAQTASTHLDLAPLRVAALAREVMRSFEPALGERRLEGRVLMPDGEVDVIGDQNRLAQVIRNLVANAVRYADAGTEVLIRVSRGAGVVRVAVVDRGSEIATDALPHVFERFVRADPSRNRESGGAGIGLAIVRELVEAHGGRVGAESGDGVVTMWFELPLGIAPTPKFVPSSPQTTVPRVTPAAGR